MKKVLITGADGFIGKHLVDSLLIRRYRVYAIVFPRNNVFETYNDENLTVISMDLNYALEHISEFPEHIDIMYHFAWIGVKPELRNEQDVQLLNIKLTVDCMKIAVKKGIKRVILPGSTNEYLYHGKPINKDALPSPCDAYGSTKVALKYICGDYLSRNGIEFIYAIITGIYAEDRRDKNVIYYTIDKLLRCEKPMLTKLEQLWDYVHIDDVINALILVGERGNDGAVYAIGHGDNWELRNYIEIIHKKIDASLPLGIGEIPYRGSNIPSSCVDLTDIEKDTGFVPQINFEDGITRVISKIRDDMERDNGK